MTTFTETFDQTDSSTVGPTLTWSEVAGNWETVSNQLHLATTGSAAFLRAQHDSAGSDSHATVTLASETAVTEVICGPAVRFSSSAATCYYLALDHDAGGGTSNLRIRKAVTGTSTTLASAAYTAAPGDALRLTAVGNVLTGYVNDVQVVQVTDSSITTGTRGGVVGYRDNTSNDFRFDNFEYGDGVGGPPPDYPNKIADRGSASNATSSTTLTVSMAAAGSIAVGGYLIARIASDNSGTSGAAPTLSVSDARNGSWTVVGPGLADPGAANAGVAVWVAYIEVAAGYTNGDNVTVTFGTSTAAKAAVIEEWALIDGTTPVAVASTTTTGSSTTPSISRTPTATKQLFYGALGIEGNAADTYTQDSDTTNGTWDTLTSLQGGSSGTATSNITVRGAAKHVTASGAQTWNPTITSRDWAMVALVFAPDAGSSPASIAASPVAISVAAQAVALSAATSLSESPATVTVDTQVAAITPGGVSLAMAPAIVSVAPQTVARAAGGLDFAVSPATVAVAAVVVGESAAASLAASPVQIAVTPAAAGITPGAATLAASPVAVPVTPTPLAVTADASLAISPAIIAVVAQSLARSAAASLAVGVVQVAVTGIASSLAAATSLDAGAAQIAVTPIAPGVTAGGTTISVSPAAVAIVGVALGINGADAASLPITPVTIPTTTLAAGLTAGGTTLATSPAVLSLAGQGVIISPGELTRALAPATVTVASVTLTTAVGGVSIAATPAALTVVALAVSLDAGSGSGAVVAACIHATGRPELTITATAVLLATIAARGDPELAIMTSGRAETTITNTGTPELTITTTSEEC